MAVMMKSAACQKMAVRSANARLPLASRPALRSVRAQQARNDQPQPDEKVEIPATGDKIPLNVFQTPKTTLPTPVDPSETNWLYGGAPAGASWPDVMGFFGAPEIINGRLAMLGFVAAMFAELNTGLPVTTQVAQTPGLVFGTFTVFIIASLIPFFARRGPDVIGPFNPTAELINGRAAMIGFAALLFWEFMRQRALF